MGGATENTGWPLQQRYATDLDSKLYVQLWPDASTKFEPEINLLLKWTEVCRPLNLNICRLNYKVRELCTF